MTEEAPHVVAEIEIDASPEEIWSVLFDYDGLEEWSNGFLGTDKPMKLGEVSTAYFRNPLTKGKMGFTHEVIVYEPNRAFGWSGEIGTGRHDHHVYEIIAGENGKSLFRQTDGLYGKPSSVFSRMMEHGIHSSYDSFNKALKARVEGLKKESK